MKYKLYYQGEEVFKSDDIKSIINYKQKQPVFIRNDFVMKIRRYKVYNPDTNVIKGCFNTRKEACQFADKIDPKAEIYFQREIYI